jgi:hypothetical protein
MATHGEAEAPKDGGRRPAGHQQRVPEEKLAKGAPARA